jgi:branched-chain amino acid transport system substrate-binding protein
VLLVALLTPMSGELATFGKSVRNGASLAVDEWNDRGGVTRQPIRLLLKDSGCDPAIARQAAEHAIADGAYFIVGGVCDEEAFPIARVANERGALFIASGATHPMLTRDAAGATRPLVFRVAYAYPYQGRAAARFALDNLGIHQAAVMINPADPWVRAIADEFSAAFTASGGKAASVFTYASQHADFGRLLADVARSGAGVLYVPDTYPVANQIGKQLHSQHLSLTLVGSEVWDSADLDRVALEGAYYTAHYHAGLPASAAVAWAARYQSAFAQQPDALAALGYDAANLLMTAIQQAGSPSPLPVAHAMEIMEYQSIVGPWHFDDQHNPLKDAVILQVHGAANRYVTSVSVR